MPKEHVSHGSSSVADDWRPYRDAALGFRNHWYPALLSTELVEERPEPATLLGEPILLLRVDGRAYAIRDRCLHRGVAFSRKPTCYQKGTLSCWYHGWTYRLDTGIVCDVLTDPQSRVIGKATLKTYAVAEAQGLVFVFIGDATSAPPLADDLPPRFLDDDLRVRGLRRIVRANWRIGAEHGFDAAHFYLHRHAALLGATDSSLPIAFVPHGPDAVELREQETPKGIVQHVADRFVREPVVEGNTVPAAPASTKTLVREMSLWLPGVLVLEGFPAPDLVQYEWYVACDEERYTYFQLLGRRIRDEAEGVRFDREFGSLWEWLSLRGFNDEDVWAQERAQESRSGGGDWPEENLSGPDSGVVAWRRLASRWNRGIQRRPRIEPRRSERREGVER